MNQPSLFIGLNFLRSAAQAHDFRQRFSSTHLPVILVSTGTDLRDALAHPGKLRQALGNLQPDFFVFFHENGRQQFLENWPEWASQSVVIPQSVVFSELPPFWPQRERPCPLWRVVMGFNIRAVKAPLLVLKASEHLKRPELWRFDLFGKILESDCGQKLQDRIASLPTAVNFQFHGPLPHPQFLNELAQADLSILCSSHEGQPAILLECLELEVPILCSANKGNLSVVGSDYFGQFPVDDGDALASLLDRFSSDENFRADLSAQIRLRKPQFSAARERQAWRELVARALASQP